jgi:hypothetical protein
MTTKKKVLPLNPLVEIMGLQEPVVTQPPVAELPQVTEPQPVAAEETRQKLSVDGHLADVQVENSQQDDSQQDDSQSEIKPVEEIQLQTAQLQTAQLQYDQLQYDQLQGKNQKESQPKENAPVAGKPVAGAKNSTTPSNPAGLKASQQANHLPGQGFRKQGGREQSEQEWEDPSLELRTNKLFYIKRKYIQLIDSHQLRDGFKYTNDYLEYILEQFFANKTD